MTDPGVTGDAQECQAHLKWHASADGVKCALAVGEMAGVFPEKVADKGFGGIFVSGDLHEKVLQFSGNASDIKDAIGPLHAFQIDANHAQPLPEKEVRWGRVTVDEHLLIFPHTRLFTPAVAQPGELLNSIPIDELFFEKLAYEPVEVGTIVVEIHCVPICRSVMEGREEVCQCGKFFVEFLVLSIHNCICDDVAQRLATAIFFNEQAVQPPIIAKW